MRSHIVKQPDGLFGLYNSDMADMLVVDLTRSELTEYMLAIADEAEEREIVKEFLAIDEGRSRFHWDDVMEVRKEEYGASPSFDEDPRGTASRLPRFTGSRHALGLAHDVATFMDVAGQTGQELGSETHTDDEETSFHIVLEALRSAERTCKSFTHSKEFLRLGMQISEVAELAEALRDQDAAGVLDAVVDTIYIALGTANTYDLPIGDGWLAVHRANMAKFLPCPECGDEKGAPAWVTDTDFAPDDGKACPTCRGHRVVAELNAQGKVEKPAGWTPPDMRAVIERHSKRWDIITADENRKREEALAPSSASPAPPAPSVPSIWDRWADSDESAIVPIAGGSSAT